MYSISRQHRLCIYLCSSTCSVYPPLFINLRNGSFSLGLCVFACVCVCVSVKICQVVVVGIISAAFCYMCEIPIIWKLANIVRVVSLFLPFFFVTISYISGFLLLFAWAFDAHETFWTLTVEYFDCSKLWYVDFDFFNFGVLDAWILGFWDI